MTVRPQLIPLQPRPPEHIRVTLINTEGQTVTCTLTLTVAGEPREFRVGDREKPLTDRALSHEVVAEHFYSSNYYLYEWAPANTADRIDVSATHADRQEVDSALVIACEPSRRSER